MRIDIVRAWKDPEYRKSLTPEEQASLPECPTGPVPTSEEELRATVGGRGVSGMRLSFVTLGGSNCKTEYPECCYNSTIGPMKAF